jgi:Flp pilus assembly protein TadG
MGAPAHRRTRARRRGAALAEFVIAVVPLLATSFAFLQLTKLQTAKLLLGHAAVCAARTAAVSSNVHANNPGAQRGDETLPRRAVEVALAPWLAARSLDDLVVDVDDASSEADPSGPVTVTVTASVACGVPMMGRVLCRGPRKVLHATATMPHQGARYEDEPEGDAP